MSISERLRNTYLRIDARSLGLFHKAIAGKGVPSATGEDGVWSLAAAEAALQSAKSGRAVAIDPKLGEIA